MLHQKEVFYCLIFFVLDRLNYGVFSAQADKLNNFTGKGSCQTGKLGNKLFCIHVFCLHVFWCFLLIYFAFLSFGGKTLVTKVSSLLYRISYSTYKKTFLLQTRDPVVDEAIKAKLEAQLRQARGETIEPIEETVSANKLIWFDSNSTVDVWGSV